MTQTKYRNKEPLADFRKFIREINQNVGSVKREKNPKVEIGRDQQYGKFIKIDGVLIAIDSWNPQADLIFVSHAHMDHLPHIPPNIFKTEINEENSPKFILSKITKDIGEYRTYNKFTIPDCLWFVGKEGTLPQRIEYKGIELTILENGHTYGSLSLLIEGSQRILYTSDYITQDRILPQGRGKIRGLKPIHCDILITECTFGSSQYKFPSFDSLVFDLQENVKENLNNNIPTILLGYSFGKSQILLNMLEISSRVILEKSIAKNTQLLQENGIIFPDWEPYGQYNIKHFLKYRDYVLIIPPYFMFQSPYKDLVAEKANVIVCSGKCLNNSFRTEFPANHYLPLSDHCDFENLLSFIKACEPQKIYLEHGKIEEFTYFLLKKLGNMDVLNLEYSH